MPTECALPMNAVTAMWWPALFWSSRRYAYIIFNQDLYDSNGNIPTYDKLGIVAHCESTDEIAEYIGCDAQAVADSFAAWNECVQNQSDPEFGSEYTWERNITTEGPWYVIKIAPGIHHTMGGIEINTEAEVISTEGEAIPGTVRLRRSHRRRSRRQPGRRQRPDGLPGIRYDCRRKCGGILPVTRRSISV